MKAVLHSVSYAGVWQGQALLHMREFLDKAHQLQFPAVMLMAKRPHFSPRDYDLDACRKLKSELDARSLHCAVVAGYNNFSADLEHMDVPHREMQIEHITTLVHMAVAVGAPIVRIFTAYDHPSQNYQSLWSLTVKAIRECARRAAPHGVVIGVQNHHDLAAHYESQFDLIEAIGEPNCRAIFDAWAPALHGTNLAAAARKMAPITCHTTVADYQLRPRFHYQPELVNYERKTPYTQAVAMGEGFIDYPAFFAALREGGYSGDVAYEMCSPLAGGGAIENLDAHATKFLAYMQRIQAAGPSA
jgi:sugar phosphate isomerase/epimerase